MYKKRSFLGAVALLASLSVSTPAEASADTFCSSFGTFSSCVDSPSYKTPTPAPLKPLPVWVCSVVYTVQAVTTVIPGGLIPTVISRVIFIPTVACAWN
jgi:hypothetical protein